MKQQITLEQWNELSDEEKKKLIKPFNPVEKGMEKYWHISHADSYFHLNKLDIGQLIEYLGDDFGSLIQTNSIQKDKQWKLEIVVEDKENGGLRVERFWGKEPIDCCMEATEHKLKQ